MGSIFLAIQRIMKVYISLLTFLLLALSSQGRHYLIETVDNAHLAGGMDGGMDEGVDGGMDSGIDEGVVDGGAEGADYQFGCQCTPYYCPKPWPCPQYGRRK